MKISKSLLRPLLIIKILRGRTFTGVSNAEISKILNEDPSQVTRALNALIHAGFVERLGNGLYALSSELVGIATQHMRDVNSLQAKINELNQKVEDQGKTPLIRSNHQLESDLGA